MDIDLETHSLHDDEVDNALNKADVATSIKEFHPKADTLSLSKEANVVKHGVRVEVNSSCDKGANVSYYEPHEGLEFETKEAAYSFYREYARYLGFGITIKASRRSKKSGKFIDVKIACSRFGSKRESSLTLNPRSCPKTDCKASMHMKRRQDGKWYIYSVVKEHNHEICPDDFYSAIRGGRYKKSGSAICQKKGLQLALDTEDVKLLFDTFVLLQSETSDFYYTVDFDKEKRMRNVFWIDGKGRHDYGRFFDVVFFDTSYLKYGYRVPFLPVVGVNHHFQYILFGCALIGDESSTTFSWLMRTWLRAVGGQSPTVVITTDDIFVKEVVEDIFPDSCHCFSLCHIIRKISQNLSHKVNQFPDFMRKFDKCIYQSGTDKDFQKGWHKLVDEFGLGDEEWIRLLYNARRKWVPTYMKGIFLGGMSTVEQSETISSFFDKYIHKETTFKEFIDQYKLFLHYRFEAEDRAEFEMRNQKPLLKSHSAFEKQMSTVYTHEIFKKFQAEVLGTFGCNLQREAEDETTVTFQVNDLEGHESFTVVLNKEKPEVSCLCCSFEYKGFLCRHAMKVLQVSGVSKIPPCYILKRWTRFPKVRDSEAKLSSRLNSRVQRLNDLCKFAIKLGEKASLSQEAYDIALSALEETFKHCMDCNTSAQSDLETSVLVPQSFFNSEDRNRQSNMSKGSKKNRILKKRKVQDTEAPYDGIQHNTLKMEQLKERTTLENSYIPQPVVQGMELGNQTPITGGYYNAQPSIQGLGQLSSVASLQEGYCSSQQSMLGLLGTYDTIPNREGHYVPQQSLQGLLQGQLSLRASQMHCFDIQDTLCDMVILSLQSINLLELCSWIMKEMKTQLVPKCFNNFGKGLHWKISHLQSAA